jgi:hypothetical protein
VHTADRSFSCVCVCVCVRACVRACRSLLQPPLRQLPLLHQLPPLHQLPLLRQSPPLHRSVLLLCVPVMLFNSRV